MAWIEGVDPAAVGNARGLSEGKILAQPDYATSPPCGEAERAALEYAVRPRGLRRPAREASRPEPDEARS
ncbi:MAG TPA: hypothetical protein VF406_12655 [Thermodesulfobacteriota bacterium]